MGSIIHKGAVYRPKLKLIKMCNKPVSLGNKSGRYIALSRCNRIKGHEGKCRFTNKKKNKSR